MNNAITLGVAALLAFLVAGFSYVRFESVETQLQAEKNLNAAQTIQIQKLIETSNSYIEQANKAHAIADQQMIQNTQKANAILNQKIDPGCEAAIKFAIEQAKAVNK